ncbi:L,D-transpeptidase, partial [Myxococcota bacterium]|nr:L,D-transpeptidase [Myxococcota bacterium]
PPPPPPAVTVAQQGGAKGTVLTLIAIIAVTALVFYLMEKSKRAGTSSKTTTNQIVPKIMEPGVSAPVKKQEIAVEIAPSIIPEDPKIAPGERVYVASQGKLDIKREADARALGYSIIDLSDEFVPFIFSDGPDKPNRYKGTYINIANDLTDEEGNKLGDKEHNYVELFGIPPSLSVLDKRFREDDAKDCFKHLNYGFFKKARFSVVYQSKRDLAKELKELRGQVRQAQKKSGKSSLTALGKTKKYGYLVKKYRLLQTKFFMVGEAQKRLRCEGLLGPYSPGVISWGTIAAIKRFEHKHMIYGWGILTGDTRRGFGRTPLDNNFRTLKRILTARITLSLGILEDGSISKVKGLKDTYKGLDGKEHKIPNLVKLYTEAVMKALKVENPAQARSFFMAVDPSIFKNFRLAVKLPPLPPYYSNDMQFSVKINRGDIWYDAPFDATGKTRYQPLMRRPRFYLHVTWQNQEIPLVRWGTTIGGWRTEVKNGKEYFAYKNSDVGPRIWKDIYSAPVWIPPRSAPPAGLVKNYFEKGRWNTRINREEIGPSFASAYGLVAAYHIRDRSDSGKPLWFDNGIRTHGSVDYMSIMRRQSHGCHRLHNHLAVRLFSTLLMRRPHLRKGQTKLIYTRSFTHQKKDFSIKLDTRGYRFVLDRPIPVMVERGRVLGKLKKPYEGYIRKPGVTYDKDDPNLGDEEKPKEAPPEEAGIKTAKAPVDEESPQTLTKGSVTKKPGRRRADPKKRLPKKAAENLPSPPDGVSPL